MAKYSVLASLKWVSRSRRRGSVFFRRTLYIAFALSVIAVWAVVMLSFANQQGKYHESNKVREFSKPSVIDAGNTTWFLKGTLQEFDIPARTFTIQWSAVQFNADKTDLVPLINIFTDAQLQEYNLTRQPAIAMYTDISTEEDLEADLLDGNDKVMTVRLDNATAMPAGYLAKHDWDSVGTSIDMTQADPGHVWTEPLFGYPLDKWEGSIVFAFNLREVSAFLYNRTDGAVVGFGGVTLSDTVLNWDIKGRSEDLCADQTNPQCELHVTITASRPALVIFCVVLVVLINWLSTIAIFLLTCELLVVGRELVFDGTTLFGVCFSALFALPTVRSLLPNAPEFAAIIDLIGIIPNVIVISLCTTVIGFSELKKINKGVIKDKGVPTDEEANQGVGGKTDENLKKE